MSPEPKHLEWELSTHPLSFSMRPADLVSAIQNILQTGDIGAQIFFFESITDHARKAGFEQIVDDWENKPEELVEEFRK